MHTYGKFTRCCSARWKFRKDHWESGWPSVSEEHVFDAGVDANITFLVAGNFFLLVLLFFFACFVPFFLDMSHVLPQIPESEVSCTCALDR